MDLFLILRRGGHRPLHQHGRESLLRDAGRLSEREGEALLTLRGAGCSPESPAQA